MTQTALLIGASRGLGAGLVAEFAGRGFAVTATVRDPARAPAGAARTLVCDIADDASVAAFEAALGAPIRRLYKLLRFSKLKLKNLLLLFRPSPHTTDSY